MTEDKFTELINLYLDREISERGLAELKAELAKNNDRQVEFRERCRLHQAMRLALNPEAVKRSSASRQMGSSRAAGSNRAGIRRTGGPGREANGRRLTSVSTRTVETGGTAIFPRWFTGAGVAACFAFGFILLVPVFRGAMDSAMQAGSSSRNAGQLVENDPLDSIGRSELRRFASTQEQRAANRNASIAAQLRLMGLRPEHTPEDKGLRTVNVKATHRSVPERSQAELLAEMQKMSPMPATQILRLDPLESESSTGWPGGFQTSLATFK